jgi:SanA protein
MRFSRNNLVQLVILVALGVIAAVLWLNLTVIALTDSAIYESIATVPQAPVALVLGASVASSGALSPVMKERADAALALYQAGKVKKILVSGDDSTLTYDEVYPVGKYLLGAGVPQQDIFLDYAGFDTYSSVYRARTVFGVSQVIIVSQRFHLPRALFMARSLGVSAVGFDAGRSGEYYLNNSLRELLATVKAVFDVVISRVPKYLGQQYPISGDGSTTWVGGPQMLYFPHG